MFISHAIIAVIFRLINFAIFIGIVVYFFRKYALPVIYTLMAKKDADRMLLVDENNFLEQSQVRLSGLIQDEVELCAHLRSKVDQWKMALESENSFREQRSVVMHAELVEKKVKKNKLRKDAHLQRLIAKKVFVDLQSNLVDYFESSFVGQEYLESLVQLIHKRVM